MSAGPRDEVPLVCDQISLLQRCALRAVRLGTEEAEEIYRATKAIRDTLFELRRRLAQAERRGEP